MKVSFNIKAVVHAKSDADAQALQKKVDALLQRHAKTLMTVEGISLYEIKVDPKITKEP